MAAPLVLILYDNRIYNEIHLAENIKNRLAEKYKEFSIKRYANQFDFSEEMKSNELQFTEIQSAAFKQARHFIMLFSPSFLATYAYQSEWHTVTAKDPSGERGIIIPICIEPCDFSHILQVTSFPKLFDAYENGTMNGQTSQSLYQAFELAQAKWEKYHTPPVSVSPSVRTTTLYFSEPDFPDAYYFKAPRRNPFFSGQEQLTKIEQGYLRAQKVQPNAPYKLVLSGLRGSGKTQIALAYAHNFFDLRTYKNVLWVEGGIGSTGSRQALDEKIKPLVQHMREKEKIKGNATDAEALREWLGSNREWLLIFDDIDDVSLVDNYVPAIGQGHVLVTTCTKIVGPVDLLPIEKMTEENAISFLLKRVRIIDYQTSNEVPVDVKKHAQKIVHAMQLFPLAIDHAGAFIDSSMSSLERFVTHYLEGKVRPLIDLLRDSRLDGYYPLTLVESWQQHFKQLEIIYPMAADLLRFCAFFHAEGTYPKIITEGRSFLGPQLATMIDSVSSPSSLDGLFKQLRRYSFIERTGWQNQLLSVHPFLPIILLDLLTQEENLIWAERSIRAVAQTLLQYQNVEPVPEEKLCWEDQFTASEKLIDAWELERSLAAEVQIIRVYKAKWSQKKEGEK